MLLFPPLPPRNEASLKEKQIFSQIADIYVYNHVGDP
jgi:hypothetical protein